MTNNKEVDHYNDLRVAEAGSISCGVLGRAHNRPIDISDSRRMAAQQIFQLGNAAIT